MSELNYEEIGKNIKKERKAKGWSQKKLGEECKIANTVISAYENHRKTPGRDTIAIIAQKLGVSIDKLCYGDESEAFINEAPDVGRKIVNCIYTLWKLDVIYYYENYSYGGVPYTNSEDKKGAYLVVKEYSSQIKRLINSLNDFAQKKNTFPEPEKYLELILSSVANEINTIISEKKEKEENKEKSVNKKSSKKGSK